MSATTDPVEEAVVTVEEFVAGVGDKDLQEPAVYVGIDPGSTGAVAFLCRELQAVIDIPVVTVAKKSGKGETTRPNLNGICRVFAALGPVKHHVACVVLEESPFRVGVKGNARSDAMLNRNYAMWPLFLYSKRYPLMEVSPAAWKKRIGVLKEDKDRVRMTAQGFFPSAPLSLKKHHNRAEALLIAEYGRRVKENAGL